jgi:hypothetical protein
MSTEFKDGTKGVTEKLDVRIVCTPEFAKSDPVDQIDNVAWSVDYGDVTIANPRVVGTDTAVARVEGGSKAYTWHGVRATITTVSGQVLAPLIHIRLVR